MPPEIMGALIHLIDQRPDQVGCNCPRWAFVGSMVAGVEIVWIARNNEA